MNQQEAEARARNLRGVMRTAGNYITDPAQASTVPGLYDYWARGDWAQYTLHKIVRMPDDRLWRFNQPALANETQNMEPGSAGSEALWSMIDYKDGYRVIPDTITSTTAFAMDELGYWHGSAKAVEGIYRSGQAGNTHVPGTTGAAWTLVEAYGQGGGTGTEPGEPDNPDEPTPTLPQAWDDFPANHLFAVGDEFSDGGKTYLVKRVFYKQEHMRPPSFTGDYYVIVT